MLAGKLGVSGLYLNVSIVRYVHSLLSLWGLWTLYDILCFNQSEIISELVKVIIIIQTFI